MTAWAKMSKTKRCWVVYQIVRRLEPKASIENIQNEMQRIFGVKVPTDWLLKRLRNFTTIPDRNSHRVVLQQELIKTDNGFTQHWRTNRA